jgi:hypothetical protein
MTSAHALQSDVPRAEAAAHEGEVRAALQRHTRRERRAR